MSLSRSHIKISGATLRVGAGKMCIPVICALIGVGDGTASYGGYQQKYVIRPGVIPANHGSSIVELRDGTLISCWYGGSYEMAADIRIYCSQLLSLRDSWRPPRIVVDAGEKATNGWLSNATLGNTALHATEEGRLWLFYNATTIFRGWSATHVAYKTSIDQGMRWSRQGTKVTAFWGNSIKNKPLALGRHRILLPLYHELFGTYGYSCLGTVKEERLVDKRCAVIPGSNHLQPALIRLPNGRVGAYLRNANKQNVLLSILSRDLANWSKPSPVNLPNPNAPVDVVAMSDGRLLAVYNRSMTDRSVLSLAVTTDGLKFDWLKDLENDPHSGGFSYPTVIQDRQRLFHVVYTYGHRRAIKHVVFDEKWLGL